MCNISKISEILIVYNWVMSFLAEKIGPNRVGPRIKWTEWWIGPKKANCPKNILTKFQSLVAVFIEKM
jgi:hypothetical protein